MVILAAHISSELEQVLRDHLWDQLKKIADSYKNTLLVVLIEDPARLHCNRCIQLALAKLTFTTSPNYPLDKAEALLGLVNELTEVMPLLFTYPANGVTYYIPEGNKLQGF
jgi:hypothetical protein